MLDMLNVHAVRRDTHGDVFDQNHPAQFALRTILNTLSESELNEIEQDLTYFSRSGLVSARIEQIMIEADDEFSQVA